MQDRLAHDAGKGPGGGGLRAGSDSPPPGKKCQEGEVREMLKQAPHCSSPDAGLPEIL